MSLETTVMVRAAVVLAATGLAWSAIAFLGVGLFIVLAPVAGPAGAAALTGGSAVVVLGIGILIFFATEGRRVQPQVLAPATAKEEMKAESLLNATAQPLALLAKDHPLLAVGAAAVLGMADSIRAERGRS